MGRKLRMVPANWQHPKNEQGRYISLYDGFNKSLAEWDEAAAKWSEGLRDSWSTDGTKWVPKEDRYSSMSYAEYAGDRPDQADYMPDFPDDERTHFMMYEDTSEGTPISPAFATAEELARWLADTGASAFGDQTASYEAWLSTINRGWACSAILSPAGFQSGVTALSNDRQSVGGEADV